MDNEKFNRHLSGVMKLADALHEDGQDNLILTWLKDEMIRTDMTAHQRGLVYCAATSYLRP